VTVNAKGRTERIFVDLESVYPTPEEIGTELSFEELRAASRGWLSKVWEPEIKPVSSDSASQENTGNSFVSVENLSRDISEKLVIARDPPMLDENGATKEHGREGRGRRMKIKEVNATQISEF
jgi:checkpoint serine/threonine-protein kinase